MNGKKAHKHAGTPHGCQYKAGSQIEQAAIISKPVRTFTEAAVVFPKQVGFQCVGCHAHLEIDANPTRMVRCPSCRFVVRPCKVCAHEPKCWKTACRLDTDPVEAVEVRKR